MTAGPAVIDAAARCHPALAPFRQRLADGLMPQLPQLEAWARECGLARDDGTPLHFVPAVTQGAIDYEHAIAHRGEIGIRPQNWHDAFNALVWLAWPRSKCALNARHVAASTGSPSVTAGRGRARDAATLLDESGLVLACDDDGIIDLLRRRAWRALFVDASERVATDCTAWVIGHGLLDKLRRPFRAITAQVLVVPRGDAAAREGGAGIATLDALVAARVRAVTLAPEHLMPLPVAGLPGWDMEGLGPALFDDVSVFRPSVLV